MGLNLTYAFAARWVFWLLTCHWHTSKQTWSGGGHTSQRAGDCKGGHTVWHVNSNSYLQTVVRSFVLAFGRHGWKVCWMERKVQWGCKQQCQQGTEETRQICICYKYAEGHFLPSPVRKQVFPNQTSLTGSQAPKCSPTKHGLKVDKTLIASFGWRSKQQLYAA